MRNTLWFITALALFALPFAAEAQFPSPKPRGKQTTQQVQPMPQPRPIEAQAEATSPIIVPAPVVNVAPPPNNDFFNWLWTAIAAIFTGSVGKLAFFPPGSKLSGLKLTPEMRVAIDEAALRAINSGIPGSALQAGAGLAGMGGVAGMLEPLARRAALAALNERLLANQALAGITPTAVGAAPQGFDDNVLSALADKLGERLKSRFASAQT